jgi:hypothetical protein
MIRPVFYSVVLSIQGGYAYEYLLFLAKGFETMEASVFIDVMGWDRNDYDCNVNVVTCGSNKTVVSTFMGDE